MKEKARMRKVCFLVRLLKPEIQYNVLLKLLKDDSFKTIHKSVDFHSCLI